MPKQKLKKFTEYCNTLLPHETLYLKSILNTSDEDRIEILDKVHQMVYYNDNKVTFDTGIDKRKYSKILQWIEKQLDAIDIDKKLEWIIDTKKTILLDEVTHELEKQIFKEIRHSKPSDYYFIQFYEILHEYRHYLLIRMRYLTHDKVNAFLEKFRKDYQRSKLIYDQLHQATLDIIGTGKSMKTEAIQWSRWLLINYNDQKLDGFTRYMSAIRYIFICVRYSLLNDLEKILTSMDDFFIDGKNYSKRILVNFYDNMLLLYDRKKQYDKAKYYGYLSIKNQSLDTLIYRNNLINVLIKIKGYDEALQIIEESKFKMNETKNFHSSIGFISNYIRCLHKSGRNKEAINKGRVFLSAYRTKIMKYRWHRFFAAYHGALIDNEQYGEIIRNTEKFDLANKELAHPIQENSKLILNIYYLLAQYYTQHISVDTFRHQFQKLNQKEIMKYYDLELNDLVIVALS